MARTMKDSGIDWIGQIPEEWNAARLKDIKSSDKYAIVDGPFGTAISTSDYRDEGMPLVRIVNLNETKLRTDNFVYITKEHADTLLRSWFYKGDIIFAKTGATVGKCAINTNVEEGVMSSSCVKIKIGENFNRMYFYYFFNTNQFNEALRMACNGTTRDTINLKPFSCLNCVIPPRTEQDKIVSILDKKCLSIDSVIEKTKASIEEYKKLKQVIISQTVTKGVRTNRQMKDSGVEWIKEMPKDWEVKKLKYITSFIQNKYSSDCGELPYIGLENVVGWNGKYVESDSEYDKEQSLVCEEGDILFGKLRPYLAKVYINPTRQCCTGEFAVIRINGNIRTRFLWYLLISYGFIFMVDRSTYGTKMPRANSDYLKNMQMPLPSIEEQEEIEKYLDEKIIEMDRLIEKKQKVLSEVEKYKKSLIFEYVTGKKEV